MIETQDVIDLRAAPAVDRLVVITDAANVFEMAGSVEPAIATFSRSSWPGLSRP